MFRVLNNSMCTAVWGPETLWLYSLIMLRVIRIDVIWSQLDQTFFNPIWQQATNNQTVCQFKNLNFYNTEHQFKIRLNNPLILQMKHLYDKFSWPAYNINTFI